jgi:hypothetical protein
MTHNSQENLLAGSVFLMLAILAMVKELQAGFLQMEILILNIVSVIHYA